MKKIFTLFLLLASFFAYSQSTTLVISQFYGAGGNTGATYNADYVELHNVSSVSQSLAGLSIQYASASNTAAWTGVSNLPAATIPAGGYYLIQMSSTGANGVALPAADYVSNPTIAMSGTSGKLALVNGTTALNGCPLPSSTVIDLVGYGTANCSETAPTAVLTATTGGIRNNNGCTDTDNNGSDFTVAAPTPRTSASSAVTCSGGPTPASFSVSPNSLDFGNVLVGTNSTSQSFNLTGANLTGAPGNITITSPSTDFQVSNDGTAWGATATIAYASATLASTQVFVRFTPQTAGPKSGNVTVSGAGVATPVNVAVTGNGTAAATPTITAAAPTGFGSVCINTTAGPNTFTINGSNLTNANITVAALAGYTYSTTSGGTYTPTLTLTQAGGTYSQVVFVNFTPTAITSYNGNIVVNGGGIAAPINVAVTGDGVNATPTVTTVSASAITTTTATLKGTLVANGCTPVTAYGFEYSLVNGFINGTVAASTNLAAGAFSTGLIGLSPSTTYYYKAFATNAAGTAYGVQLSFITASPPPSGLTATALTGFGTLCIDSIGGPNSFTLTGTNLTTADVKVGPFAGYSFSTTSGGTYTDSLLITQPGGALTQQVFVKFSPDQAISYDGNIPVRGGGSVAGISVPVIASGINSPGTARTDTAFVMTSNIAEATGSILDIGCSNPISYGIEYSGVNGFVNGSGTRVPSINLASGEFSSTLTGLVNANIYYYKAYVINNGGVAYGSQRSFITPSIGDGLIIYNTPIKQGDNMHISLRGIKPGHYSARVTNIVGQLVFQKDFIIQVNFIDENFVFPSKLPIGVYNLQIRNHEYKIQKRFMVQ
ncbi:MAG TPA: lamin tail domain-containing protein [Ferruginibacter sp.]|nr:lamin tail domain-containing protein [Ferruginibacter sp.]